MIPFLGLDTDLDTPFILPDTGLEVITAIDTTESMPIPSYSRGSSRYANSSTLRGGRSGQGYNSSNNSRNRYKYKYNRQFQFIQHQPIQCRQKKLNRLQWIQFQGDS